MDTELTVFESEGQNLEQTTREMVIRDTGSYELATILHQAIKSGIKKIENYFEPRKAEKRKVWQDEIEKEKACLLPFRRADVFLSEHRSRYDQEQQRKAREEQARLQALAQKEAEERRIAEAVAAEQKGDKELAEEIITRPDDTPPVIVQSATPHIKGASFRDDYKAEVEDLNVFRQAICQGKIPWEVVMIDQTFLNRQAKAYKDTLNWPGVRIYKVHIPVTRS